MTNEEQLQTEFEIEIPGRFFYEVLLKRLVDGGYEFDTGNSPRPPNVLLRSLASTKGSQGAFTLASATCFLESILRESVIKRFILLDNGFERSLHCTDSKEEAIQALAYSLRDLRLYENCASFLDERGLLPEVVSRQATGRLPYMAYHCAVDGLTITHVSQAFFKDQQDAEDALEVLARVHGFQSLYMCIKGAGAGREGKDGT
jgi:hypothetical protein